MVLHDLNQAARFADYIIALKDGEVVEAGDCEEIMNHDVLKKVFHIDAEIGRDPRTNKPTCITYNLLKGEEKNEKTIHPIHAIARANY
jgi:iron complex transport system ATP-binding protein